MKTTHANLSSAVDELVLAAQKPSRYVGGEFGSVRKDLSHARVRFALAFPDTYEVGMSNLGFRLLYHLLNDRPDVACERVFLPWPDMEGMLRERGLAALHARVARARPRLRPPRGDAPVRARLHERPRAARPRRDPAPRERARRTRIRSSSAAAPARSTRSRWRTSSTASPWARARRSRSRSPTRSRRAASGAAAPSRARCSGGSRGSRACTSRPCSARATIRRRGRSSPSSRSCPATRRSSAASCPT